MEHTLPFTLCGVNCCLDTTLYLHEEWIEPSGLHNAPGCFGILASARLLILYCLNAFEHVERLAIRTKYSCSILWLLRLPQQQSRNEKQDWYKGIQRDDAHIYYRLL